MKRKTSLLSFLLSDRKKFEIYSEALEYAEKLGRQLVMDYMVSAGLGKENIKIDVSRKHLAPRWLDGCTPGNKTCFRRSRGSENHDKV